MTRTSFFTAIAVGVTMMAFATPAAAQRRGGHSQGASHGVAVARSHPVAVPRTAVSHGYYGGYYRPYYRSYYYHPYYYRPYYSFVPRVSIGIGLWAGYPVAWSSYYYGYPYAYPAYSPYYYGYPAPPAYPYAAYPAPSYPSTYSPNSYPSSSAAGTQPSYSAPPNSVDVQPGRAAANTGGVSIDVDPPTASVFIDGKYMGTGAEFGPNAQPLGLTPGRHRIEIRAEGYQSMTFDADVTSGEVTPYRASLQRR